MGANQLYANGRVASLSTKIFQADKFNRLTECASLPEALKVLAESGFGAGVNVSSPNNYEELLKAELDATTALFNELCLDENAKKYFLCKYDYVNAKILMKCKYMRQDGIEYCFNGAEIPPKAMQEAFVRDDYSACPQNMAKACDEIDASFADGKRSPQIVDYRLDLAMYADMLRYAKKSSFKPLKKMFEYKVDTTNLMTLYRLKKANAPEQDVEKWIIPNGRISLELLKKLWNNEQNQADLPGEYKGFFDLCKAENSTLAHAEQEQSKMQFKFLSDNADFLTVQPVLDYFVKKVDEIDKVRKILVAIKSGVDKEKIKELVK